MRFWINGKAFALSRKEDASLMGSLETYKLKAILLFQCLIGQRVRNKPDY